MTTLEYLNIIFDLINTSLRSRLRKTIAGFVWVILNPIITYLVHCFLLSKILNIHINNIGTFLLAGVLPWSFFNNTIEMSIAHLANSKTILQTFNLKPNILIISQVLENFILSSISFLIVILCLFFIEPFNVHKLLYILIPAFYILIFTFLISFILAFLNIFYRDIKFIASFFLSILFFLTPIFYPESLFPQSFSYLYQYNPIYIIIKPMRFILHENSYENFFHIVFLKPLLVILITTLITNFIWNKYKHEFYKRI